MITEDEIKSIVFHHNITDEIYGNLVNIHNKSKRLVVVIMHSPISKEQKESI